MIGPVGVFSGNRPPPPSQLPKSRLRRVLFACLLVACSVFLTVAALEVCFRVYEAVTHTTLRAQLSRYDNCFEPDSFLGHRLKANASGFCLTDEFYYATYTNSLHKRDFRDAEHQNPRGSSKYVILALGDSFAFGTGVDLKDTFLALTEQKFDNVLIIKAGVPGYDIFHYFEYLRCYGLDYEPDMVLINLSLANDLRESMQRMAVTEDGYLGTLYRRETASSSFVLWQWSLFKKSALFRFMCARGLCLRLLRNVFNFFGDKQPEYDEFSLRDFLIREAGSGRDATVRYQRFTAVMAAIKRMLSERGIALAVNMVPFSGQFMDDEFLGILESSVPGKLTMKFDRRLAQERAGAFLKVLGIDYLDPYEDLAAAHHSGKKLFWKIDGHFSQEGNRVMAGALTDFLKKTIKHPR